MIVNKVGRETYLKALQRLWPEALNALQHVVYPKLKLIRHGKQNQDPLAFWNEYQEFMNASSAEEIQRELRYWARDFNINDDWMLTVARQTMFFYGEHWADVIHGDWRGWIQLPLNNLSLFEARLYGRFWIPPEHGGTDTWKTFSDRQHAELQKRLLEYQGTVYGYYGKPTENMERDAEWAVLCQKGASAEKLASTLPKPYTNRVDLVAKAVSRFSKSIGLTLRTKAA